MEVHVEEYERPQHDSEDEGQQLAESMDCISVAQCDYHTDK
jgi:hypothetical protein